MAGHDDFALLLFLGERPVLPPHAHLTSEQRRADTCHRPMLHQTFEVLRRHVPRDGGGEIHAFAETVSLMDIDTGLGAEFPGHSLRQRRGSRHNVLEVTKRLARNRYLRQDSEDLRNGGQDVDPFISHDGPDRLSWKTVA